MVIILYLLSYLVARDVIKCVNGTVPVVPYYEYDRDHNKRVVLVFYCLTGDCVVSIV